MSSYKIRLSRKADIQLIKHTSFLVNHSISSAKKFADEYQGILERLQDNPLQFPVETDEDIPDDKEYRKALFAKNYKILFQIKSDTIFIDAIVDCRQDNSGLLYTL